MDWFGPGKDQTCINLHIGVIPIGFTMLCRFLQRFGTVWAAKVTLPATKKHATKAPIGYFLLNLHQIL